MDKLPPHSIEDEFRRELEEYKKEKDRVRSIIGQIGGTTNRKKENIINIIFLALILIILFFHFTPIKLPFEVSLEIGVLLVSIKIIWMMHTKTKVDHFQFWILNSIEFRVNNITTKINSLEKKIKNIDEEIKKNS